MLVLEQQYIDWYIGCLFNCVKVVGLFFGVKRIQVQCDVYLKWMKEYYVMFEGFVYLVCMYELNCGWKQLDVEKVMRFVVLKGCNISFYWILE